MAARKKPQGRLELLEALLRDLSNSALSILVESNGLSDNEWKTPRGTFTATYPVRSYRKALDKLDAARMRADEYLDPNEADRMKKWANACSTASFIVDQFKSDEQTGRMAKSSLHRNIADAIFGSIVRSPEDREAGIKPVTMIDRLNAAVEAGKLVKFDPSPSEPA